MSERQLDPDQLNKLIQATNTYIDSMTSNKQALANAIEGLKVAVGNDDLYKKRAPKMIQTVDEMTKAITQAAHIKEQLQIKWREVIDLQSI